MYGCPEPAHTHSQLSHSHSITYIHTHTDPDLIEKLHRLCAELRRGVGVVECQHCLFKFIHGSCSCNCVRNALEQGGINDGGMRATSRLLLEWMV